jgi:Plavaka transposase
MVHQTLLEKEKPGATIIPIIILLDETQLTLFRNKSAYLVYLTIGNLPKDIHRKPSRQGQILIGYLPTSKLELFPSKAGQRHAQANLFHACIDRILEPLQRVGIDGLFM